MFGIRLQAAVTERTQKQNDFKTNMNLKLTLYMLLLQKASVL